MSMEEKTIGIVVVTYNRLPKLKINIEHLLRLEQRPGYNYKFVIVNNNSLDGTREYINQFSDDDRFIICNLEENIGGSGGFYYGIKKCCDQSFFAVWGMDDDAYPDEKSLTNLLDIGEQYNFLCCLQSNSYESLIEGEKTKQIKSLIFVGFFLTCAMILKIGNVKKNFFIMHDDTEYSKRLISNNIDIIFVRNSFIVHKSECVNYYTGKYNKNLCLMKLPDWKMYYLVRNHFFTCKLYNESIIESVVYKFVPWFFKTLLFCPKQCRVLLKALIDGISGNDSKYNK